MKMFQKIKGPKYSLYCLLPPVIVSNSQMVLWRPTYQYQIQLAKPPFTDAMSFHVAYQRNFRLC